MKKNIIEIFIHKFLVESSITNKSQGCVNNNLPKLKE